MKVSIKKEKVFVPDISYIDMPPMLVVNKEAQERLDKLAAAFGYTDQTISNIYKFAQLSLSVAQHYKGEAERIRDSKKQGKEVKKPEKTVTTIVKLPWHKRLIEDIQLGRTIAVRGPAGNGKSTGVKSSLEYLGYNIYHLDCTDTTSVDQLVGGLVPEPDGVGGIRMAFRDGLFSKAFKDPHAAIQLDEFDALDPRVALCLQSALHRAVDGGRRWLSIPDNDNGGMQAKGDCPIIVTMNTYGSGATREYVGRNTMDIASMDRFNSIISTSYESEEKMVAYAGYSKAPIGEIVLVANSIRKKIDDNHLRIVLSTRRVIDIAEIMEALNIDLRAAFKREFYERLEPQDQKTLNVEIKQTKCSQTKCDIEIDVMPFEGMAKEDMKKTIGKIYEGKLDGVENLLKFFSDGGK